MKQIQFNNPNLFAPKDAWDRLSLAAKAEMMKVAVKNGIYDLQTIRNKYNEFAEGGDIPQTDWSYDSWKKQIALHKGIDVDGDRTYDYEGFFHKYPQEAWAMLSDDPEAHFTDEFKTVYHPTFSAASQNNEGNIYSRIKHPIFNPEGLRGGTWSPDYKSFTMSVDGYRGPVSMDDRKWYLENAEDNGVQLREADGSLPIYDGVPWAGVLPAVTVTGKKHSIGGPLVDALLNEYAKGGGIHIKPSHRGRLTELKKRTGKSEAELYRTGSAATRKMITFARNARKWKHGEGGNLYDGESQDSQQLVIGRNYWQQQAAQPQRDYLAEMVEFNRKKEAERQQRVAALRRELTVRGEQIAKKKQKEYLTMSNDNTWVEKNNGREKNPHLAERAVEGAKAHAAWAEEHPVMNAIGLGLGAVPFAVASVPVIGGALEAAPVIAPGSAFWMNPITQQVAVGTLGGMAVDAATNTFTPYNNWAEGVSDLTGLPEFVAGFTNPGYMIGGQRFGWDLLPSPLVPSRGSAQMNYGRNFGLFNSDGWNNWGSESLTRLGKNYAVKVPKSSVTSKDVGPKVFDSLGWKYRAAVNEKMAANKIPGFEPYEYIGYHTTKDGYIPIFRQNRLSVMGDRTPEGIKFNEEALADIEKEMGNHSGLWKFWGIGDFGSGHNIGKNTEGIGRLFDANYSRDPLTWIMQNFPREWEFSPIGSTRLVNTTLKNSKDE